MAALTPAQIIAHARLLALDTNATDQGLSDDQYLSLTNEVYYALWGLAGPRVSWQQAVTFAGTIAVNAFTFVTSLTDIDEIISIHRGTDATTGVYGPALAKRDSVAEIVNLIATDTTKAAPNKWAAVRTSGTNKWQVFFHPIADTTYYLSGIVRKAPTALTVVGAAPDVTEADSYLMARLVAARAAIIGGRDDAFVAHILEPVPQAMQQAVAAAQLSLPTPRAHKAEKAL